jgi:hypothetical protein
MTLGKSQLSCSDDAATVRSIGPARCTGDLGPQAAEHWVGYKLGRLETIHPQPRDMPMDAIVNARRFRTGMAVVRTKHSHSRFCALVDLAQKHLPIQSLWWLASWSSSSALIERIEKGSLEGYRPLPML